MTVSDRLLRNLADLKSNVNLEPQPTINVERCSLPEGEVAVVEVTPSDLPPVRYKGTIWVRTGPSRRRANRHEERILTEKRVSHQLPFDAQPCLGCTLRDLALDLFRVSYLPAAVHPEIIEENDRPIEEQMASLQLFDLARHCPTNAGALLLAKNPLHWLPGAWIQFVRWAGQDLAADPINEKEFHGDLMTVLKEINSFIPLLVQSRLVPESSLRERKVKSYPVIAIRELLLNAIMHRSYESNAPVRFYSYEDRIEIQNPGGLYRASSPDNFPRVTDYRNPVLSSILATLGYVNHFGRGIARAQQALARNGNPDAVFDYNDRHHFHVSIGMVP